MGDLSEHFSYWEFMDSLTGDVCVQPKLVEALEVLRGIVGKPLNIVSGYRTKATNAAVGGATNSQHCRGRAVDLPPYYASVAEAAAAGFTGIGYVVDGDDWWAIHVDVREQEHIDSWEYKTGP